MSKIYSTRKFGERVGRIAQTVRRWERECRITAKRLPSGHRYFDESDVRQMLGGTPEKQITVVYCRVSSACQKDDLASQVSATESYCRGAGIAVDEWVQEIASGMDQTQGFLEHYRPPPGAQALPTRKIAGGQSVRHPLR